MRWLLVFLAACGGSHHDVAPPTPPPDAAPGLDFDEEAARQLAAGLVDVLGAMAEAINARVEPCLMQATCEIDCGELAGDLDAIFDASAALFDLAAQVQADDAAAKLAVAAMRQHDDVAKKYVQYIGDGLALCRGNADVAEAIARMPTL